MRYTENPAKRAGETLHPASSANFYTLTKRGGFSLLFTVNDYRPAGTGTFSVGDKGRNRCPRLHCWRLSPSKLVQLSAVDVVIVVFYFALVLAIGWHLRGQANTGEDFFMAGREMTAWVAGLSFLSANLGSLELMGWAGSAYQYGILAAHWYWIGAIPAMLFLGLVMMPFYYISKTHSVPGYLKLRFGEPSRAVSAVSFAFMTVLMSGINMYSMALVMKVVLGWDINFSIWVSSVNGCAICGSRRPAVRDLQRGSAVHPHLGWSAPDPHPRTLRGRRLGNLKLQIAVAHRRSTYISGRRSEHSRAIPWALTGSELFLVSAP